MANDVFANGLEIACKAADGKSVAAFPDPCWSPPDPSKVVIPYANTAYAKDTKNGSKTVRISGKEVMKKDVSYFKTSTGNEPAAGAKGISTGVKKGKAYFTSWSMNVMVEGENVDRHTDGMTHNHGSKPGNTGVWKYWDTSIFGDPCKAEFNRVERKCGGQKKKQSPGSRGSKTTSWVDVPNKAGDWKKKHCKFLSFKPNADGLKGVEDPTQLLKDLKDNIAQTDVMNAAITQARDAAMNQAMKQLAKLGFKFVAGKVVPIAGWVFSLATAADDIAQTKYYKAMYDGAVDESTRILDQVQNVRKELQDTITAVGEGDFEGVSKKLADWQRSAATVDDCLRARKCMLVPMRDTFKNSGKSQAKKPYGRTNSGGNDSNKGCCPGQTGHHLIPDAFVKNAGCSGYGPDKDTDPSRGYYNAPVVCAEGTKASHEHGSHGAIHTATTEMLVPKKNWNSTKTTTASYEKVRDGVAKAHAKAFPFSACSKKCIAKQLDKFYKDKRCGDLTVKRIGSDPGKTTTDNGGA